MRIRKRLAAVLAAVMLVSLFPVASAQELQPKSNIEQGITLNKQATGFSGWDTTVTLDVVANTNENPIAIQFVLDATQSMFLNQDTGEFYVNLWANALSMMQDKKIYAGLTIFGEDATTVLEPTLLTEEDPLNETALTSACADFVLSQSGTNVQAGIREGLNALNGLSTETVAADHRYMVLITDGGSFWRLDENGNAINDTYNNGTEMGNSDAAELAASGRGDVLANTVEELLAANMDTRAVDYTTTSGEPLADVLNQIVAADAYTNFEKGIYAAAKELDSVEAAGVKLVTVGYPYYSEDAGLSDLTELAASFVDYAQSKSVRGFDATLESTKNQLNEIISSMYGQEVNVAVRAGSVITDVIGHDDTPELYDFNVATSESIRVSLSNANGTNEGGLYNGVQKLSEDGIAVFKRDGKDFLTIQYTEGQGDNEKLTITLNQDLLRGQKLSISYIARLVRYNADEGTHTVYPNVEAYLTPAGTSDELMFPRPSVDYTMDYPDGGDGGGDTTIDDGETPLGPGADLNTEDHYAYIVGRDDGLVHPLDPIYRSEVASIFFRMLTEDSRQMLWSTENPFYDVDSDDWFNNAISTLTNGGVLSGKPGNIFDPDSPITRAEFATIAVQFFGGGYEGEDLFTDISGHWARDYINRAAALGIISGRGDGTFDPDASITRAEAMSIVNRTLGRAPHADYLLDDMITWPDNMDTSTWYYAAVQEATNSHDYENVEVDGQVFEQWTVLQPVRDWAALESEWAGVYDSENPGEVMP